MSIIALGGRVASVARLGMHLDEIASRVWGCVDGGGLLLMGLCCELRVVVNRWQHHCVLSCVHVDGNGGMARVCRKEEGSEIWLRPKSVVDLGVERVRGFSLNLPIPEEETTGAERCKAGTSKPRASFHRFTRLSPASPTEKKMKSVQYASTWQGMSISGLRKATIISGKPCLPRPCLRGSA
jgi:hypothetical protein